ncbi:MAG: cupin domain-containing protein [Candidatus Zixiibacteriota bacterium]|nr:MAG: cupin domain-containing protein [candidate division Zixibacteria bacterium]
MLIRRFEDCKDIIAGDNTRLRELLHPDRDYPFTAGYSLAHATLPGKQSSRRHRLTSDEVYYILSGTGVMHVDEESAEVAAGDAVDIPPGSIQWIENTGQEDLAFLCIVFPAWRTEDETVLD